MMLSLLIALPFSLGLLIAMFSSFFKQCWSLTLVGMLASLASLLWCSFNGIDELQVPWLLDWGVSFHLRMDALSLLLLLVAHVMGIMAMLGTKDHQALSPLFYSNILWLMAAINGVLLAHDLLLFFLCWEGMIIPLYFLILAWGESNRTRAAQQFFIFTQSSGLFMLVAILSLYFIGYAQTGIFSFDPSKLSALMLEPSVEILIFSAFMFAFLVKLPTVPFHVWLPELFIEAPLAPLLMGIMVKTGAYGIIRFGLELFPNAALSLAPIMMGLGVFSLFFGALLAFSQNDIRKILAYSTISHMGLVLMALFSTHEYARTGAIILLITGALNTGSLLLLFAEYKRNDLNEVGGLFAKLPKMGVITLFLVMSSLGLPLFGQFVGEWFVIVGIFATSQTLAILAALGLVVSAIYHVRLLKKLLFGKSKGDEGLLELSKARIVLYGCLISLLLFIGLYPTPIISLLMTKTVERGQYD